MLRRAADIALTPFNTTVIGEPCHGSPSYTCSRSSRKASKSDSGRCIAWPSLLSGSFDQLAKNLNAAIEVRQFAVIQSLDRFGERFYSTRSTRDENALAFRRRHDSGEAFVVRVGPTLDESVFLQPGDDLGHRRRPYLLGAGELAEGDRASEYHDRQCRQPRRRQ